MADPDPYSVKEIMKKVGGGISEAFSGPTSNYLKRKEREKREGQNPNADKGRAAATARAIGSTLKSLAVGDIGDTEKMKKGGASSSLFSGVVQGDAPSIEEESEPNAVDEGQRFNDDYKSFLDSIDAKKAAGPSELMQQANKVMADMKARNLNSDLLAQATELGAGVTEKPFTFDGAVDEATVPRTEGEFTPKPLETTGAYNDAMAAFKENFPSKNGNLIINEGETGDEYSARLKERNAARSGVQALAPISVAEAPSRTSMSGKTPDASSSTPKAPSYGVIQEAPSRQVQNTANRMSQSSRLKGRQQFGAYLADKLDQGGGRYEFSSSDAARAKELGIGNRELGNFTRRRARKKENQFGALGGLS